ncbi:MAG: hypothetical protein M3Y39_01025 [Chloroflexota bacterium]|nr:hypothetical protein [Chloroflexota bacterium]
MLFPAIVALSTIFFYFLFPHASCTAVATCTPGATWIVFALGMLFAFIATTIVAFFRYSAAIPERGNIQSYSLIETRLKELDARIELLQTMEQDTCATKQTLTCGLKEAKEVRRLVDDILASPNSGYQWISGAGYVRVLRLLYQIEEAIIEAETTPMLIRDAMHDQDALQGSNIHNSKKLGSDLTQAIKDLEAEQGAQNAVAQIRARAIIHHSRHAINDFRITHMFELVQQRSNLVLAIIVTGVITYLLVCLALLSSSAVLTDTLQAGTAYFIVGAAAGLFGRLYSASNADRASNDYGLSIARVNATAHLSGIAGVGGVFVSIALLTIANAKIGNALPAFTFSLPNLLIAATFGLTPNLLIKNLQKQAEKSISDLESVKTTNTGKNCDN